MTFFFIPHVILNTINVSSFDSSRKNSITLARSFHLSNRLSMRHFIPPTYYDNLRKSLRCSTWPVSKNCLSKWRTKFHNVYQVYCRLNRENTHTHTYEKETREVLEWRHGRPACIRGFKKANKRTLIMIICSTILSKTLKQKKKKIIKNKWERVNWTSKVRRGMWRMYSNTEREETNRLTLYI